MEIVGEYLEHKSHIIWDWNGTLLNDMDFVVSITNAMLIERGFAPITLDFHRQVFCMPVRTYYDAIGFRMTAEEWPEVARQFQELYRQGVHTCALFDETVELLSSLKYQSKRLAVLSAAHEEDLRFLLRQYKIDHHFDHICGLKDHFAVSKVERGFELLAEWKVERENVVLIGDMDHDLEVGQALGIDVITLGDGHQHVDRHLALHKNVIPTRLR